MKKTLFLLLFFAVMLTLGGIVSMFANQILGTILVVFSGIGFVAGAGRAIYIDRKNKKEYQKTHDFDVAKSFGECKDLTSDKQIDNEYYHSNNQTKEDVNLAHNIKKHIVENQNNQQIKSNTTENEL